MVQKNTHIAFASSYIMNHAGMRERVKNSKYFQLSNQHKVRGRSVEAGVCVCPQEATAAVLTGPETHREVLLPNRKGKCQC